MEERQENINKLQTGGVLGREPPLLKYLCGAQKWKAINSGLNPPLLYLLKNILCTRSPAWVHSPVCMYTDASLYSLTCLLHTHLLICTDSCCVSCPCSHVLTFTWSYSLHSHVLPPHPLIFFLLEQLIINSLDIHFVFSTPLLLMALIIILPANKFSPGTKHHNLKT